MSASELIGIAASLPTSGCCTDRIVSARVIAGAEVRPVRRLVGMLTRQCETEVESCRRAESAQCDLMPRCLRFVQPRRAEYGAGSAPAPYSGTQRYGALGGDRDGV